MKHLFGLLLTALVATAASSTWADTGNTTYYAKLTVGISDNSPTGAGTVYAATSKTATSGSASATGSASSKTAPVDVTVYGFAKANDYYDFKGWSTSVDGANPSGSSPKTCTISSSDTSSNPSTGMTIYAVFAKHEYTPFDITFTSSGGGSYIVNGAAPANMTGLKYATKISLSSDDASFFKWNINGQSIDSRSYELTCTAATTVEAVFITADQVKTVTTKDELSAALQDTKLLKVEIPASASILIPAGETLTVPEGLTLVLDGRLLVRGSLVNNGIISGSGRYAQSFITISQGERNVPANSFTSYPTMAYHKTTVGAATSGTVSGTGTISCTKLGCVVGLAGTDAWADSTAASPAAAVVTVDNSTALNKITAVDSAHDTVAKAINAAYPNLVDNAKKFVVLMQDSQMLKVADLANLNAGWKSSNGQICKPFRIDAATYSFTISSIVGGTTMYAVNGKDISISGSSIYVGYSKAYFVGATGTVKAKINSNANATSLVALYDCAALTPSADGSADLAVGCGFHVYTTGSYVMAIPSTTKNLHLDGGTYKTSPASTLCASGYKGLYNETTKGYDIVVNVLGYNFYVGDKSVAANQFDTLADAIKAANGGVVTLAQGAGLAQAVSVSSKAVLDLNGLALSGPSKITVNAGGDLTIIDTSKDTTGTCGPAIDVNGKLTVAYGTFTGEIAVKSGGTMTTYDGIFKSTPTLATGATADFRGGKFVTSVANYLTDGYWENRAAISGVGTYYCVGKKFAGQLAKSGGSSDLDENFTMKALTDSTLLSKFNESKPTFNASDPSAFFTQAEASAAIKPLGAFYVDLVVSTDRDLASNTLCFKYLFKSEPLPAAINVGDMYRAFYYVMVDYQKSSPVKFETYLTDSQIDNSVSLGFYNAASATANLGAVCTFELCLYNGNTKAITLDRTRVTLGARNNKAYIKRNGTPTFYSTLAGAVNAAQAGETVVLARDNTASVTVSKDITIDTKGFALGPVTAGAGYRATLEGDILNVTRGSGLMLIFKP